MPVKFDCPKCNSRVQISSKVPYGAPIKCPTCEVVFPNPAKYQNAAADAAHDARRAEKEARRAAKEAARAERRARRGSGASNGLLLKRIGIGAALVLVLFAVGAGGMFLVNHFRTPSSEQAGDTSTNPGAPEAVHKGNGKENPLAYLPADVNTIIGMNAPAMAENPALKGLMEQGLTNVGLGKLVADCKKETGLEFKDLCQTTIFGLKMPAGDSTRPESVTVVLRSGVPFDAKKITGWVSAAAPQKVKDKLVYDKHKDATDFKTVYFPTENIVVLSDVPASKWDALLTTDGSKPALSDDALNVVGKIDKSPFWVALPFDAKAKDEIKADKGPAALAALMPAAVQPVYKKQLGEAKGMGVWGSVDGGKVKLNVALACANEASAKEIVTPLYSAWLTTKEPMAKGLEGSKANADTLAFLKDLTGSLTFGTADTLAAMSMKLDPATVEKLTKDGIMGVPKAMGTMVASAAPAGTPTTTPTPPPPPPPPPMAELKLSPEETKMVEKVNELRKGAATKPGELKPNAVLFAVARAHAAAMAKAEELDDELGGKGCGARLMAAGYKFDKDKLAVNLTAAKDLTVDGAFGAWAENNAAKGFMLDPNTETGIGIAKSEKGEIFYYMIYATPEK